MFHSLLQLCRSQSIDEALVELENKPNSPLLGRKLVVKISSSDFGDFCKTAADAIVGNLLLWLKQQTTISDAIDASHLEMIDTLVKKADEQSMLAMSLLLHISKANLLILAVCVEYFNDPASFCIVNDQAEIPSDKTLTQALDFLKSDLIATKLADVASKCTDVTISPGEVVNVINSSKVRFVSFKDQRIKAWSTANGVAINVSAVNKQSSYTLHHPVALCSIIGHEFQHYLNRHQKDDLNISTPELVSTQTSPTPSVIQLATEAGKGHCEAALFFELGVIGEKINYSKTGATKTDKLLEELLELLSSRISAATKLPLLEKHEIVRYRFYKAEYNREFAFDFSTSLVFE